MKTMVLYAYFVFFPPDSGITPTMSAETTMDGCQEVRQYAQQLSTQIGNPNVRFSECVAVEVRKAPSA